MLLNTFLGASGVGAGSGYFFEERFEGTGYDNSNANGWVESGTGTIDEDYTGVVLEGSQSLRILAATQQPVVTAVFPSDQDELWVFFRIQTVDDLSGNRNIFRFFNSGGTAVYTIGLNTDNGFTTSNGTTTSTVTTDKMSVGSAYNVWGHYLKGSGADGVASVGFSATGTEVTSGTSYKAITNGVATTDAHEVRIGMPGTNTTGEFIIDKILMSTTATIGNDPA